MSAAAFCVGFAINYFTDGEGFIFKLINTLTGFAGVVLIASFFLILHFWGSMYFSEPIAFKRSWRKAAERGDAEAQTNLGVCYCIGEVGFPQDYAEAVKWLRLAAEQGYARAQGVLGQCYKEGAGVKQDDVLAYMWFDIAMPRYEGAHKASMWFDSAMPRYEGALSNKASLDRTMTPEQIAEAQKLSREWKPKTSD